MMRIEFHKNFIKNFKKRFSSSTQFRKKFEERVKLFSSNPKNILLKDHALQGDKLGLRSFSITGDVRVVYIIKNGTAYFLDIGTHNQVY